MFNKREEDARNEARTATASSSPAARNAAGSGATATIGASVHIKGEVQGEENLIIEGHVNGVIKLKSHTLTIGKNGQVEAEIYAHNVRIEGQVTGDVLASEQISITQTAQVQGNVLAPRISLEDGAKFRGSIDMDTESERFRKTFNKPASIAAASASAKQSKQPAPDNPQKDLNVDLKTSPDKVGGAA